MMKRKILVVDGHPLLREGLARKINGEADLTVCGEASSPAQALRAIAEHQPDVVVTGLLFNHGRGLDLITDIASRYSKLPMIVLSGRDERLYAQRVLRNGAQGYIMKHEATETIINAIREVLAGRIYLSGAMRDRVLGSLAKGEPMEISPLESLTDRELEVYQLLGEGLTCSQIAQRLHLSSHTIQTYYERIKVRLNVATLAEVRRHAVLWTDREHNVG
jgi:DNA-binding NarL/FixJ family response regulator